MAGCATRLMESCSFSVLRDQMGETIRRSHSVVNDLSVPTPLCVEKPKIRSNLAGRCSVEGGLCRYRQFGGGLFPKTCFKFVHRSNSPGERSLAPMLLDLVDNLTHSSYISHS